MTGMDFEVGTKVVAKDSNLVARIILGANVRPLAKLRGFKFLVGEYFVS